MTERRKYLIVTKDGDVTYELHETSMPIGNRAFHESIGSTVREMPIEPKDNNFFAATAFVFVAVLITYLFANRFLN